MPEFVSPYTLAGIRTHDLFLKMRRRWPPHRADVRPFKIPKVVVAVIALCVTCCNVCCCEGDEPRRDRPQNVTLVEYAPKINVTKINLVPVT
jgi:hypothetical protein